MTQNIALHVFSRKLFGRLIFLGRRIGEIGAFYSDTMSTVSAAVNEADASTCTAARKFGRLFYDALDRKRNIVNKMYTDDAKMVWNGNAMEGRDTIATFLNSLPDSEHNLKALDAQPINEQFTSRTKMILLNCAGTATYYGKARGFTQTIMLQAEGDVWKIASDRFRFID